MSLSIHGHRSASAGKEKEAEDVIFHGDALAVVTAEQDSFNKMRDDVQASAEAKMRDSSSLASKASTMMIMPPRWWVWWWRSVLAGCLPA
jgi:hypothetical protein